MRALSEAVLRLISDLEAAEENVIKALAKQCPAYRKDFSKTKNTSCFMNHCDACNAKMGDFYMHNEPGGAFFPEGDHYWQNVRKTLILDNGRYGCYGSFSYPST